MSMQAGQRKGVVFLALALTMTRGGNKKNVIAEASVLPLASLKATPQKEFAITNSFAPTESHILFGKCWPRPHWGVRGRALRLRSGPCSLGDERERPRFIRKPRENDVNSVNFS